MNNFSIALKVKPKHGQIYNYMVDNDLNLDQMCSCLDISKATLESMLHFRWKPNKDHYQSMATIQKIEKFFDCAIEDLFPTELTEQIANNNELRAMLQGTHVIQKEIDIEYLSFDQLPEIEYTPDFDGFELTEKIESLLDTLTPIEQKVLCWRFGLRGEPELTLEEIGVKIGTQRERPRQIEAKALRKLKHPVRLKELKKFVDV